MKYQFSLFENHSKTKAEPDVWTPEKVLNCLRSNALAEVINKASHARRSGDEEAVREIKKTLPCVTPSGTFKQRNGAGLIKYSRIVVLDYDKLQNPTVFRQKIIDDPHVILAFLSPTHTGIKVWIVVDADADHHHKAFRAAADYMSSRYGEKADETGKDVSRLCYLSYDPNAHFNADASPLTVPAKTLQSEIKEFPSLRIGTFAIGLSQGLPEVTQEDAHTMLRVIKGVIDRPSYDQWLRIVNAVRSHFGDPIAKAMLERYFPSEEEREYDKKFAHPCERIGIGTLIHEATQCGFDWPAYLKRKTSFRYSLKNLPELALTTDEAPFPVEALPSKIKEVVKDLAKVHQVPISLPALSALAVASGSIGTAAEIYADHRGGTRPNLYVIIGAERGCGKSGVATALMRPLQDESARLEKEWRAHDPRRKAHLELLREKLKKSAVSASDEISENEISKRTELQEGIQRLEDELKYSPQLWMGDATSEAMAKVLSKNDETNMSFSADAGDPIRMACGLFRKSGGDVEMYLKAWSGDSHAQDRILRDAVRLTRPCLTILWLVQGMLLAELVGDPEVMERGFLARCFIVETGATPQEVPVNHPSFQPQLRQEWEDVIKRLLAIRAKSFKNGQPLIIKATPEAKEVFRLFGNEAVRLGQTEYMDIKGELTRWRENSIRLAGLFAIIDETDSIGEELAKRAVEIVRWCGLDYLRFLGGARRERLEKELLKLTKTIEAAGGEIASGELQSNHGYRKERLELAIRLVELFPNALEMQEIAIEGKAGAPKTVFRVKSVQKKQ